MDCKGLVYELIDIVDYIGIWWLSNAGQLSQQIVLIDGIL